MTKCPHCQSPLDETTLKTFTAGEVSLCPHCGRPLTEEGDVDSQDSDSKERDEAAAPDKEPIPPENEADDFLSLDETIDFSEADLDEFLPEEDLPLEKGDSPERAESGDPTETIEFLPEQAEDDELLGGKHPSDQTPDGLDITDTDDEVGATIEVPAGGDEKSADLSDLTIEFEDDADSATDRTVDFAESADAASVSDVVRSASDEASRVEVGKSSDPEKTIDQLAGAETTPMEAALDDASAIGETTDLPGDGPRAGDTAVNPADAATIEMTDLPLRPAERHLSQEQLEKVTNTWSSSYTPDTDATVTIKHGGDSKDIGKSTLVVRSRAVRKVKEPATTGADYELLSVIGRGGMGVVYAARQASVDRTVALKMLKTEKAKAGPQRGKFMSEAVVTGDLDHPNIVPIYELGTSEDGALFYSMKRVQGTPWSDMVGKNSLSENVEILMKVADAVAFAHANGVIHRDLKPENVMLGAFGEVLVMDWGLALATSTFRHEEFVTPPDSMGGTPAYMAPEMATGPFERIGQASDIYLLGAMLFEIVTGKTPHYGENVRECLIAAANNKIVPAESKSELLSIAYRAMATEPEDRYKSVLEFQDAIREYQSHSESIVLATRAEEELAAAGETDDYQDYARAMFAFEESLHLWPENQRARDGVSKARLAYAESANHKEDHELGVGLLDEADPEHQPLLAELRKAQRESRRRQRMLKLFKVTAAAMVAVVLVVVTVAFFWIRGERNLAIAARDSETTAKLEAENQRDIAAAARDEEKRAKEEAMNAAEAERIAKLKESKALKQTEIALANEKVALANEKDAREATEAARKIAVDAQKEEQKQRKAAESAREIAQEQRDIAIAAKDAEEEQAYIARIGLAQAKTEENAFSDALRLLDMYLPRQDGNDKLSKLRQWEWGRLRYLASLSEKQYDPQAAVDSLAVSADGSRFATGGRDGQARIWDANSGQELQQLDHGSAYIFAVAFSPDGKTLATGSSNPDGYLTLWDATTGEKLRTLAGHKQPVLSVSFSRDGDRLLSSSYDGTAKLWDLRQNDRIMRDFVGHQGWVWSAALSPDEQTLVTAGQDGTAILWSVHGEPAPVGHLRRFLGHDGPVLTAAFSPDGKQVASGGYDRRILIWNVDETQAFDLDAVARGGTAKPQPFRTLAGHNAAVRSIAFSPSGEQLISAGQDNAVRVWELASGDLLETLRGHSQRVSAALFTPDGKHILSAGHDRSVRRWSLADYRETRVLEARRLSGHDDAVLAAAFSPDGSEVVTASRDRSARVWDTQTGQPLTVLAEGHAFLATRARFFANGERLITAAGDNTARVWNVKTGTQLFKLAGTGRAAAVALSHDERLLLTGGADGRPQLWNAQTGELLPPLSADFGADHRAEISAVAFSADDKILFTGDEEGRAFLWDAKTGKRLATIEGHSGGITAASFLPDGSRIVTASADGTVGQWNAATGKEIIGATLSSPDAVEDMAVSPDGARALTACADGRVRLWDLQSGEELKSCGESGDRISVRPTSVAFSNDGRTALIVTSDNRVRLWPLSASGTDTTVAGWPDVALDLQAEGLMVWSAMFTPDGQRVLTIGGAGARLWDLGAKSETLRFSPHAAVASASFSPDSRRVVTGSWDHSAKIWDVASGRAVLKLAKGHDGHVNSAVFSPDAEGRLALTASDDGTAKIWNSQTGQLIRSLDGHTNRVLLACFSPDGRIIATASADQTARLWNSETGEPLHTLRSHRAAVLCAAISRDGQWVATGAADAAAKLWNVATGEEKKLPMPLVGHTAGVSSVAFSPDGRRLLTGSQDGTAKLWDTDSGREILTLRGHSREVTGVAFSPDGLTVLTSSRDGTAVLWPAVDWRE